MIIVCIATTKQPYFLNPSDHLLLHLNRFALNWIALTLIRGDVGKYQSSSVYKQPLKQEVCSILCSSTTQYIPR